MSKDSKNNTFSKKKILFYTLVSILTLIVVIYFNNNDKVKTDVEKVEKNRFYAQDTFMLSLKYPFLQDEYNNEGNWMFVDRTHDISGIKFSNFKACYTYLMKKHGDNITDLNNQFYECLNTDNGRYFNIKERIEDFKKASEYRKKVYHNLVSQINVISDNYKGEYDQVDNWVFEDEKVTEMEPFYNAVNSVRRVKTFKECMGLINYKVMSINYSANIRDYKRITTSCKNENNIVKIEYIQ